MNLGRVGAEDSNRDEESLQNNETRRLRSSTTNNLREAFMNSIQPFVSELHHRHRRRYYKHLKINFISFIATSKILNFLNSCIFENNFYI